MSTPWYDPNLLGWLPGTVFGTTVGLWGGLSGWLAPQGRARRLILGAGVAFLVIAVTFLVAAGVALAQGQPYGVWYGLGLPGVLGVILIPLLLPTVRLRYSEAEMRKISAADQPLG